MKTPLPEPFIYDAAGKQFGYTDSQLRAAMVAAYNGGIEDAAKKCEDTDDWVPWEVVAVEVRKLKEQTS